MGGDFCPSVSKSLAFESITRCEYEEREVWFINKIKEVKYLSHYHPGLLLSSKHPATAKSLQSCPTLCDPIPGILQARTLEWVAISFSNA